MLVNAKYLTLAALTGLVLLAAGVPAARAQAYPSVYWGYVESPYTGMAHLVRAQGQFAIDQQRAVMERERIIAERVRTRRSKLEQYLWERDNLPTIQDDRERNRRLEERRALDPPVTEIWSGKSLNDLLGALKHRKSAGGEFASIALDREVLRQINVTSGKSGGNIGLIKGGKIAFWPILLQRPDFTLDREKIEALLTQVVKQAEQGTPIGNLVWEMIQATSTLQSRLERQAGDLGDKANQHWTPGMYIDAKRFLGQLQDALLVLQEPDAGQYLAGKVSLESTTVADLVREMKTKGLAFAPATPGAHRAYNILHTALVDFASESRAISTPTR
jgi:hypothetical protein